MEATVADRNETCPTCRANDRDWRGVVPAPSDIPGVQLGTTRCFDPWHDAAPALIAAARERDELRDRAEKAERERDEAVARAERAEAELARLKAERSS